MSVRVTAPVVVLHDKTGKTHYRYHGAVLRDGEYRADDVDRLLDISMVEEIDDEPAPAVVPGPPVTGEPVTGGDGGAAERPKQTAPKEAWVAYAVARGMAEAEAEERTKAELIAQFGTE